MEVHFVHRTYAKCFCTQFSVWSCLQSALVVQIEFVVQSFLLSSHKKSYSAKQSWTLATFLVALPETLLKKYGTPFNYIFHTHETRVKPLKHPIKKIWHPQKSVAPHAKHRQTHIEEKKKLHKKLCAPTKVKSLRLHYPGFFGIILEPNVFVHDNFSHWKSFQNISHQKFLLNRNFFSPK